MLTEHHRRVTALLPQSAKSKDNIMTARTTTTESNNTDEADFKQHPITISMPNPAKANEAPLLPMKKTIQNHMPYRPLKY